MHIFRCRLLLHVYLLRNILQLTRKNNRFFTIFGKNIIGISPSLYVKLSLDHMLEAEKSTKLKNAGSPFFVCRKYLYKKKKKKK